MAAARARPPRTASPDCPPARDHRRELGLLGERFAADHFARMGFRVLARNVRTGAGEIDLIAFDGRTLAFVEVKTRLVRSWREPYGPPLAHVRAAQRTRVRRAAAAWLCDAPRKLEGTGERPSARDLRLDAVAVLVDHRGRLVALDHVESAW
jgi:putative endonuclease